MEGNPKSEVRSPKEGRTPKFEGDWDLGGSLSGSEFWAWGADLTGEPLALRDDAQSAPPPRELLERTTRFGETVIRFAKRIPQNPVNNRLIDQVVGAGTSIAANYCEADDAVSGKDFRNRIGTARKESKETMLFLRLIATAEPNLAPEARQLWREAKELNLIFGSIWRKGQ